MAFQSRQNLSPVEPKVADFNQKKIQVDQQENSTLNVISYKTMQLSDKVVFQNQPCQSIQTIVFYLKKQPFLHDGNYRRQTKQHNDSKICNQFIKQNTQNTHKIHTYYTYKNINLTQLRTYFYGQLIKFMHIIRIKYTYRIYGQHIAYDLLTSPLKIHAYHTYKTQIKYNFIHTFMVNSQNSCILYVQNIRKEYMDSIMRTIYQLPLYTALRLMAIYL
eukprot:TRINITY_DN6013_c0_g1_i3.p2 TRINITY_DN6013_c0_g1~~TRINITY_DN6013_c0_g1_i3.p2  ORF type:complete len:218 (-),score=-20.79 TRINITY_DN6013_c0_g1_i3:193-846(-)